MWTYEGDKKWHEKNQIKIMYISFCVIPTMFSFMNIYTKIYQEYDDEDKLSR
jgi:hypothetical protein